jgi:hypothetical protein
MCSASAAEPDRSGRARAKPARTRSEWGAGRQQQLLQERRAGPASPRPEQLVRQREQPLQSSANGNLKSQGNDFIDVTGTDCGGTGFTPPYDFTLDSTAGLEAAIEAGLGPKQ